MSNVYKGQRFKVQNLQSNRLKSKVKPDTLSYFMCRLGQVTYNSPYLSLSFLTEESKDGYKNY